MASKLVLGLPILVIFFSVNSAINGELSRKIQNNELALYSFVAPITDKSQPRYDIDNSFPEYHDNTQKINKSEATKPTLTPQDRLLIMLQLLRTLSHMQKIPQQRQLNSTSSSSSAKPSFHIIIFNLNRPRKVHEDAKGVENEEVLKNLITLMMIASALNRHIDLHNNQQKNDSIPKMSVRKRREVSEEYRDDQPLRRPATMPLHHRSRGPQSPATRSHNVGDHHLSHNLNRDSSMGPRDPTHDRYDGDPSHSSMPHSENLNSRIYQNPYSNGLGQPHHIHPLFLPRHPAYLSSPVYHRSLPPPILISSQEPNNPSEKQEPINVEELQPLSPIHRMIIAARNQQLAAMAYERRRLEHQMQQERQQKESLPTGQQQEPPANSQYQNNKEIVFDEESPGGNSVEVNSQRGRHNQHQYSPAKSNHDQQEENQSDDQTNNHESPEDEHQNSQQEQDNGQSHNQNRNQVSTQIRVNQKSGQDLTGGRASATKNGSSVEKNDRTVSLGRSGQSANKVNNNDDSHNNIIRKQNDDTNQDQNQTNNTTVHDQGNNKSKINQTLANGNGLTDNNSTNNNNTEIKNANNGDNSQGGDDSSNDITDNGPSDNGGGSNESQQNNDSPDDNGNDSNPENNQANQEDDPDIQNFQNIAGDSDFTDLFPPGILSANDISEIRKQQEEQKQKQEEEEERRRQEQQADKDDDSNNSQQNQGSDEQNQGASESSPSAGQNNTDRASNAELAGKSDFPGSFGNQTNIPERINEKSVNSTADNGSYGINNSTHGSHENKTDSTFNANSSRIDPNYSKPDSLHQFTFPIGLERSMIYTNANSKDSSSVTDNIGKFLQDDFDIFQPIDLDKDSNLVQSDSQSEETNSIELPVRYGIHRRHTVMPQGYVTTRIFNIDQLRNELERNSE